jgi:hypothetical protein
MGAHIEIRPLSAADALACDAIVASLAYHFANEEGRAEAAAKVRTQPGLVAVVDGAVAGFLTVERHFDHAAEISWMAASPAGPHRLAQRPGEEPPDGYQATRAFYRQVGFVLARDLPGLWPGDTAVMMVRQLP